MIGSQRSPIRTAKLSVLHAALLDEVDRPPPGGFDRLHAVVIAASLRSLIDQLDRLLADEQPESLEMAA